jgi:hypothetical protein
LDVELDWLICGLVVWDCLFCVKRVVQLFSGFKTTIQRAHLESPSSQRAPLSGVIRCNVNVTQV